MSDKDVDIVVAGLAPSQTLPETPDAVDGEGHRTYRHLFNHRSEDGRIVHFSYEVIMTMSSATD